MIREAQLIDFLASRESQQFSGDVYRATRINLDPTIPSAAGGRWMPRDGFAVLYASLEREGALAELSYRLSLLTPIPTKPIAIHTLRAVARKAVRITKDEFPVLGIDPARFGDINYLRTQIVGDAVGFLEFDAMLVPSARWPCENLVLLHDHLDVHDSPTLVRTEEVTWVDWAKAHGFIPSEGPSA